MKQEIRKQLIEKSEKGYQEFSSALIPNSKPILGVRLPVLRKMAKEIAKGNWRSEVVSYEGTQEDLYFEETMLRGMIIGYGTAQEEATEGLRLAEQFIPHIDNWSVCDSFCSSFTLARKCHREVWEFLQTYLYSEQEFEVRTALVMCLQHYLKFGAEKGARKRVITMDNLRYDNRAENSEKYFYKERILETLNREFIQGYYAQMAAAWTAAEAFVTFPYETMQMLTQDCKMDRWTYKKTWQKIRESNVPDNEVKEYIKRIFQKQ